MKTKKLTLMALTTALAMILSFVESQIPSFTAIPGVKVGLANIAVMFALYKMGLKEAVAISLVRVVMVSLLFGTIMSLFYSLAGAALSLCGMVLLKKIRVFSTTAVSVAGGVLHNVGQIIVASLILETNVLGYYLPFLILSGTIAGIVIGLLASVLIKRISVSE